MNKTRTAKIAALFMLSCAAALFSAENITNYSSSISVRAFLEFGDTLRAASSGGLFLHDLGNGGNSLVSNARIFPDPSLTALCRDSRGNLWAGSDRGYLYKMTPRGQWSAYSNYKVSGWSILCLYAHGDLIVVGSDKGVSLFDPERGVVVMNAGDIRGFSNPRVNAVTVFGDTLFLGCDEGVAYLDGLGATPLRQRNFYDPGIWKIGSRGGFVRCFVDIGDAVLPSGVPAAVFGGRLFTPDSLFNADSGWRVLNDAGRRWAKNIAEPPGKILSLHNEGDRRLWIGTDARYYFSYDGESAPRQFWTGGIPLRKGERIAVSGNGDVWVTPAMTSENIDWHHGVFRYDGRVWHRYNRYTFGERFGYIGDGSAMGLTSGRGGEVWVGMFGGNIKHIDPAKDIIGKLIVGYGDFTNHAYYTGEAVHDEWGKVDAVALDSAGYLWASAYDHNSGSLFCYDTRKAGGPEAADPDKAKANRHYRWFFNEYPLKTMNITELCVDAGNRIFAYDGPQNRLTIFSHGGNPLADSIRVDASYAAFGAVKAIRSAPDGTTYIAGAGGLKKVSKGSVTVETVADTLLGLSGIAFQDNVLWLGSHANGVRRYDIASGKITKRIGETEGLPSDNVTSIAIDNRRGHLWMLTENAVSRLDIGRSESVSSKEPVYVFPNVFSIGRSNQGVQHITFARLEPNSTVSIYSLNGALVAKAIAAQFTENEWRAAWAPKQTLSPGTYIAAVKPSGKRVKIILKP